MPANTYYDRVAFEAIVGVSDSLIKRRLYALAEQTLNAWQDEARSELNTTLQSYLNNLSITEFDGKKFRVTLVGTLPNMLEQGMGPGGIGTYGTYDLRTFILKQGTKSLRRAKDGRLYVNIPFRHGVEAMKEEGVYNKAKRLKGTLTNGEMWRPPNSNLVDPTAKQPRVFTKKGGKVVVGWGGRLGEAGQRRQWWWHSKHMTGLVRMQKTYSKATQSSYMTWRKIIQWSPKPGDAEQAKWWHPGIKPHRFAERVMLKMDGMIKNLFGREG